MRPLILAIDDNPGRFDELARRTDIRLVVTCDHDAAIAVLPLVDAILLDHDMPGMDGRQWARALLVRGRRPVVIVSTTGLLPDPRPEMVATLRAAGWPVLLCPADHFGCEDEWVTWIKGALGAEEVA